MKSTGEKRPAKKAGILAVLCALMFTAAGARAGSNNGEFTEAGFTKQLAELSRALKASSADLRDRNLNMNELLDLLDDREPAVRKAAVKSSRNLIQNSRVYERVMEMMENSAERTDVRVEAARALSYAAHYNRVQEGLARTAQYGSAPVELRVMAYKALWSAANGQPRAQEFLIEAVRYNEKDPAARRAAIWALFDAARNNRPRELLTELLSYGNEEESVRIEAIKSLYNGIGYPAPRELMLSIARDTSETKQVRSAALLALSGAAGYSSVRDLFETMIRYETDPELRAVAVEASSPSLEKIREYFHLGYNAVSGGFMNPIERE
ncbi:MAG: HEAT repeat domain-containing protein [Elusimicrobia bacterium]|nr:HEAT repeat domain-containing protein [Elusimicrobiota bacterium]